MKLTDLQLVGSILYKCEGSKLRRDKRYSNGNTFYYAIEFTNSDPVLIKLFLKFVFEILFVEQEKIKIELFVYDDLNIEKLENYWSKLIKIPKENFYKTIVLKAKNSKYRPNPMGTCKIRCFGKKTFLRLNEIIEKRLGKKASLIKNLK